MQETRRFKYVVEIPGDEAPGPIWEQRIRVAAYCRVSTEHEEQQNSLRNQIEFYKDFIRQNPYWRFVAVYYDAGSGLRANHRPEYRQMPDDCDNRKIDMIIVKSLSRFGRNTVDTLTQIRRLKSMNIGVYIEVGGINTLTARNLIIEQLAAIDKAESCSRSRDIEFGLRHRMMDGRALLNHARILGCAKSSDGVLQIVP